MTISVLLADDQSLVRAGFHALLARGDEFDVVGEAADGEQAVEMARRLRPAVVLMDIRMPKLDGIQATARICADPGLTGTRIIVVTTFELDEYVHSALRAGASGFLLKDLEPEELRNAVHVVARGDALIAPKITRRLISEFSRRPARRPEQHARIALLTDREREVVVEVAGGLNNEEIAASLFISPATVKTHVSHAMTKLSARDRAQLVVFAYESGLVPTPGP